MKVNLLHLETLSRRFDKPIFDLVMWILASVILITGLGAAGGGNSNWVEKEDGWHKEGDGGTNGNADYFSRPIPPVRDGETGHPIGRDGNNDWARVIQESNEKHNQ